LSLAGPLLRAPVTCYSLLLRVALRTCACSFPCLLACTSCISICRPTHKKPACLHPEGYRQSFNGRLPGGAPPAVRVVLNEHSPGLKPRVESGHGSRDTLPAPSPHTWTRNTAEP